MLGPQLGGVEMDALGEVLDAAVLAEGQRRAGVLLVGDCLYLDIITFAQPALTAEGITPRSDVSHVEESDPASPRDHGARSGEREGDTFVFRGREVDADPPWLTIDAPAPPHPAGRICRVGGCGTPISQRQVTVFARAWQVGGGPARQMEPDDSTRVAPAGSVASGDVAICAFTKVTSPLTRITSRRT